MPFFCREREILTDGQREREREREREGAERERERKRIMKG
jgi:hypothetical protein